MHLLSICPALALTSVFYMYMETLQSLQQNQKEAFKGDTL